MKVCAGDDTHAELNKEIANCHSLKSWKNKLLHPKDRERDRTPNPDNVASTSPPTPAAASRLAELASYEFPPSKSTTTSSSTSETSTLIASELDVPTDFGTRRRSSQASHLSTFDIPGDAPGAGTLSHSRKSSADRRLDPLGITVLYAPNDSPIADVVFVHGLGGTSQCTWSKNRDLELFWPKEWLPFEPVISGARILTFGYNAHFLAAGPGTVAKISDFAKSLLFEMKFSNDQNVEDLNMGKVL